MGDNEYKEVERISYKQFDIALLWAMDCVYQCKIYLNGNMVKLMSGTNSKEPVIEFSKVWCDIIIDNIDKGIAPTNEDRLLKAFERAVKKEIHEAKISNYLWWQDGVINNGCRIPNRSNEFKGLPIENDFGLVGITICDNIIKTQWDTGYIVYEDKL